VIKASSNIIASRSISYNLDLVSLLINFISLAISNTAYIPQKIVIFRILSKL
jgi:hypothetical protein